MHFLKNELCREINRYSKILIYGAGNFANKAYELLKETGLSGKISSFIVTELKEHRNINGIPIRSVNQLELLYEDDSAVLVAVSKAYEDEIVQLLQKYNNIYIIKYTDYIIRNEEFYELLKDQTDHQFAESVLGEYVWNRVGSLYEFDKEVSKCIAQRNKSNIDRNTIVYISGDLKPRSEKIIDALVKKKYHVIVLEYGFYNKLVITEVMSSNIEFFHCRDIVEIYYRALQYQPLVYYYEPEWGGCIGSDIMIKHKELFGKIVFATYDVMNDGFVQISEKDKLEERYCLENADGIVWRWFSKEFLEEKKGFVFKGKSIQFVDYCKGFEIETNHELDDKVKICFVQSWMNGMLDKITYTNDSVYTEPARIDTILSTLGNRSDCLFHIFIGRCDDADRKKLEELEKRYVNFKTFYGMKYNELILKISEYDYGCFLMTEGIEIPEQKSFDNMYWGSAYTNSVTNRFSDYLDATLPIISTTLKKQCDYLDKYGVVIKMNISNIDIDYLKKNRKLYRKRAEKAKAELLIDNHILTLIDWFNEL